jgi:DNA-binding FrmR family transcriptional regulator
MLEEANALHATINRYRREGQLQTAADLLEENRGKLAVRGRLNAIALQVRNVNNQIRLTQLSRSMSADEKKARIDALLQRKNELTARVAPLSAAF